MLGIEVWTRYLNLLFKFANHLYRLVPLLKLDFYNGCKSTFWKECVCFKALTFIVINLELLPYNSSTLSPKKYHRQDGVLQTPKTIHFMVLWRPRSLLSSVPLYGDQITARKIYIDIASIFHCLGIGLFIKNALSLLKKSDFSMCSKATRDNLLSVITSDADQQFLFQTMLT